MSYLRDREYHGAYRRAGLCPAPRKGLRLRSRHIRRWLAVVRKIDDLVRVIGREKLGDGYMEELDVRGAQQ